MRLTLYPSRARSSELLGLGGECGMVRNLANWNQFTKGLRHEALRRRSRVPQAGNLNEPESSVVFRFSQHYAACGAEILKLAESRFDEGRANSSSLH